MERRLSAIMSADVVGYSRLMGANEVATLESLNNRRAEILEPLVARHGGRVFKFTGDGILAEFPSVVGAVEGALAIQAGMHDANSDIPDDRRIDLRIGIHVGDVICQDEDLFGDGVNLAARIESVARPGRVAVSQAVRDHVGNKLDVQFEDRGEQDLKNIDRPVRVFEIEAAASGAPVPGESGQVDEKPSVAVLPFNNMSGDPDQEFFSDGISEDLITDLSKVSGLFVVGRHTSFAYKGKSEKLEAVARELGVRYLLEGSVRKAGNRVRITGQLIDCVNGGHVWAERYDRDLTDIFAIQDEITKAIVDQLKVRLLPEERKVIGQAPTESIEAYTLYLKGREVFHNPTKSSLGLARQMFVRAAGLDPAFARAYAGIANCDARLVGWYGLAIPFDEILAMTDKALGLDPHLAEAYAARGEVMRVAGRSDEAVAAFKQALALDPNSFEANLAFARYARGIGELERSAELFIRALELQPDDYQAPLLVQSILFALGRKEEAVKYIHLGLKRAEEAIRLHPEGSRPAQLAAAAVARLGDRAETTRWIERSMWIDPDDGQAQYNAACAWALLGESERAFDMLDRWTKHRGVLARNWLERDPDLDPIRAHPRYAKLLQTIASAEGAASSAR